jgi:hypothetical protein
MAKTSLNKLNTTKTQPKKDDRACDTECVWEKYSQNTA